MDKLLIYPDPILRKKALLVKNIDGKVKKVADRMAEAMYAKASKGAAGAGPEAGPQEGPRQRPQEDVVEAEYEDVNKK